MNVANERRLHRPSWAASFHHLHFCNNKTSSSVLALILQSSFRITITSSQQTRTNRVYLKVHHGIHRKVCSSRPPCSDSFRSWTSGRLEARAMRSVTFQSSTWQMADYCRSLVISARSYSPSSYRQSVSSLREYVMARCDT